MNSLRNPQNLYLYKKSLIGSELSLFVTPVNIQKRQIISEYRQIDADILGALRTLGTVNQLHKLCNILETYQAK